MSFPEAGSDSPFRTPRILRVVLADFRSYPALDLRVCARMVALAGDNGAGKTNLLEALSLFTPGRGLRRAELAEMAREGGSGGFAVSLGLGIITSIVTAVTMTRMMIALWYRRVRPTKIPI